MAEKPERKFLKLFYDVEILGKGGETEKKELEKYVSQMTPKKLDLYRISKMTPEEFEKEIQADSPLFSAIVAKRCIEEHPDKFKEIDSYKMFEKMCDYVTESKREIMTYVSQILEKNMAKPDRHLFAS